MSVTKVTGMMQTSTKGGDIASGSPTVIDTDGDYFDVTGTTNFAAFTVVAGRRFTVQFDGVLTMTHHATTLDLPGAANITTAAGDVAEFFATGTNTVQCVNYTKANGTAVVAASGGKILQVVSATKTDTFSSASDSFVDITGVTVNITPAATGSKILIWVDILSFGSVATHAHFFQLVRDSTAIAIGDSAGDRSQNTFAYDTYGDGGGAIIQCGFHHLDSPSTTSQVTYKLQGKRAHSDAGTFYIGRNDDDADFDSTGRYPSTITVMEVAS